MNKMNSKGQMGKIVSIILIISGAIILYMFVSKVGEKTSFEQSINACRLSVLAQSSTEVAPTFSGLKSPFDINCDKRYVTFYNTRVELGLSPENMKPIVVNYGGRKVKKFSTLSDSIVDQTIAEEMRICKYQFAEGKIEIFKNNNNLVGGADTVCFICSEITFENENIETETFKTFLEYTKKTRFGTSDQTYYEYFTEKTTTGQSMWSQPTFQPGFWDEVWKNPLIKYSDLDISTSEKYLVFVQKFNYASAELFTDNEMFLAVVPAKDIDFYCELQAS